MVKDTYTCQLAFSKAFLKFLSVFNDFHSLKLVVAEIKEKQAKNTIRNPTPMIRGLPIPDLTDWMAKYILLAKIDDVRDILSVANLIPSIILNLPLGFVDLDSRGSLASPSAASCGMKSCSAKV